MFNKELELKPEIMLEKVLIAWSILSAKSHMPTVTCQQPKNRTKKYGKDI